MFNYNFLKILDNPYRADLVVKINFIISCILNLLIWLILYIKLQPFSYLSDSGQVYLHYNIYFGIDNIGSWYKVFIMPLLGLFFIIFNNILASFFYLEEKMISYFLSFTQTVLEAILLAAAVFIILLNI